MGIKSLHKQTQNFPQILNQIHSTEVRVFHLKITTENFSFHEKKKPKCTLKMTKIYYLK